MQLASRASRRNVLTNILIVELTALDKLGAMAGVKAIRSAFFESTHFVALLSGDQNDWGILIGWDGLWLGQNAVSTAKTESGANSERTGTGEYFDLVEHAVMPQVK